MDHLFRYRPGGDRRLRGRPRFIRRHQRALAHLRRANRTRVDPNQEMVGLGRRNLAAGFFLGFPSAAVRRAPRSPRLRAPRRSSPESSARGGCAAIAAGAGTAPSICPSRRWLRS
jgi:hypothetical protein